MAREVLIKVWCDVCKHHEPPIYNDGQEFTVAMGNAKPRVLALCEADEKALLAPLRDVLPWGSTDVETGPMPSSPRAPKDAIGPRNGPPEAGECPACHREFRGLVSHWRTMHQDTERQSLGQALGMETPYQCSECPLAFSSNYGLAQHTRQGNHV